MSYELPWWLWLVLSPLLVVVGLGAIAAAVVLIGGGGWVVFDALFGGTLDRGAARRQLRTERAALEKGHWPPLAVLHRGPSPLAARWAAVIRFRRDGEVTPRGAGAWQIGELEDGTAVVFHHRADVEGLAGRTITVGDGPHLHVGTFVLTWAADALRARALQVDEPGATASGYRDAPSIDAAFRRAAAALGSEAMLAPPPPSALTDLDALLAYAQPSLPGRVLAAAERSTLVARYEAWLDAVAYEPRPPLSEFAELFPEHASAGAWIALTAPALSAEPEPEPEHDPDAGPEVQAQALYLADPTSLRIVDVRMDEIEPWIRADHRDACALLIDRVLTPAVHREIDRLAQQTLPALTL